MFSCQWRGDFWTRQEFEREQMSVATVGLGLFIVSLPVLLLLCFFHAVDEALPPRIFLLPPNPLLLTFELCTEWWETWPCLPGRLTKAAAATALCSWEEEEKVWGRPLTPTDETPWDSWPWELCGELRADREAWVPLSLLTFAFPCRVCEPAWWSDAGPCLFLGWTGADGGRTHEPEPASAAGTPAAPLSTTRTMSCCGGLTRTSAGKCAVRFPAPAAAPSRKRLSACWCAPLSEPFSDWMTCTVHKARARLSPCPASSGR